MVLSTTATELQMQDYTPLHELVQDIGLSMEDLQYITDLSPYLILDGHRTGNIHQEEDPTRGYVEGAIFSLRFARIFQEMGGSKATFLIHTLRNYRTMDRMQNIFDAVGEVGKKFVNKATQAGIRLRYFGQDVHTSYALAKIINFAEQVTKDNTKFELNFLTNYSEIWGNEHFDELSVLPEITVIGRFTKGHYSGAGIPGHADKANFLYIQQASISENWTDQEIVVLILSLLKSHLALNGFVGGKSYTTEERETIRRRREVELFDETIILSDYPNKRITSFSPSGPMNVFF